MNILPKKQARVLQIVRKILTLLPANHKPKWHDGKAEVFLNYDTTEVW